MSDGKGSDFSGQRFGKNGKNSDVQKILKLRERRYLV